MPDTPDPVANALDVIRAHSDLDGPRFNPNFTCDVHVPRLLAAVEAALKLADDWRQESEALRDAAGKVWEDAPDAPGVRLKHAYAAGYAECAKALKAAITAALAGKEDTPQ